jgi:hypothetical protein
MQMTSMAAESMGMGNAGKPQPGGPKPMPSQPALESSARVAQGTPAAA